MNDVYTGNQNQQIVQEPTAVQPQIDKEEIVVHQPLLLLVFRFGIAFFMTGITLLGLKTVSTLFGKLGISFNILINSTTITLGVIALIILCISIFVRWYSTYFIIKSRSVEVKSGIILTKIVSFTFDTFGGVGMKQGLLGKILNYGTLVLIYKARDDMGENLVFFPNPTYYKDLLTERVNNPFL